MPLDQHEGSVLYARSDVRVIDCERCGFAHLLPKPDPVALESFYQETFFDVENPDYLAKTERELEYWDGVVHSAKEERLRHYLGGPGRILDIGCCGGFLLRHFALHGWSVHGIEPGRSAYEWATGKYSLPVTRAFFETVPEADLGRFDAVHMAFVLEHVHDPTAFLRKVGRVLRPGGVLCVEVPNDFNRLQAALTQALGKDAYWVCAPDHVNYFSFDSLEGLLRRTGFTVLQRQATFPLELFPLMGDDYIGNDEVGLVCHQKRMRLEQRLHNAGFADLLQSVYAGLAANGLGREAIVYARWQ